MDSAEPSRDHADDANAFRARLRQDRIAASLAMPDAEHARASARIEAALRSVMATRRPQAIGFCWPIRREFDSRPLVSALIGSGWHACQPVVAMPAAPMQFRAWKPDSPMTADWHGIPIPDTPTVGAPAILLLPLVAFDAHGYRIGYGGGYFDRTLAALHPRPLTIGVGFELGRVDSVRPQPHDIRLDVLVTEAGTSCVTLDTDQREAKT